MGWFVRPRTPLGKLSGVLSARGGASLYHSRVRPPAPGRPGALETMTAAGRWAIVLVVAFVVLSVVATSVLLWSLSGTSWTQGERILHLRLDGSIPEIVAHDPLTKALGQDATDLRDILDALERARTDRGIKGVLVEIGQPELGWAQNEEVRAALVRLRETNKFTWAYMETAGEFSGGNGAYMLAAACEKIFLSPPGDVGVTGLRVETPFVRGLLDKLGVVPQFAQRKEFKNAANTYTEKEYTPAHREATGRLIRSLFEDMVAAIADGRKLTPARVRELVSSGPFTGPEALERGLVDELVYRDEVIERVEAEASEKKSLVGVEAYLREGRPNDRGAERIALVYGVGGVNRGRSGSSPLSGDVMGSDTIVRALRTAREDRRVAAVVFRVDSPGGSYVASDLIRREVELTKKVKPVIVSMGNLAASGGYFVSMQANRILAGSGTITGSIGVFGGKLVTRDMWKDKLGVTFGPLQEGDNADFWSSQNEYTARGWERMNAGMDRIYADFTQKAAAGRGMPIEQLEPLAHGRVWSGRDALERKLVDEIGGLREAIEIARREGKIDEGDRFEVIVLPRPTGILESFLGDKEEASLQAALAAQQIGAVTRGLPREARDVVRALSILGMADRDYALLAPSIPVIR